MNSDRKHQPSNDENYLLKESMINLYISLKNLKDNVIIIL